MDSWKGPGEGGQPQRGKKRETRVRTTAVSLDQPVCPPWQELAMWFLAPALGLLKCMSPQLKTESDPGARPTL